MAKESFDKEIQFLRMLALTSGAFSRQQFAERLGISVHTFDKTLRRLKEVVSSMHQHLPQEQSKEFSETIRFSYYDSTDPLLLFLFRAKSVKESESQRISLLIAAMNERALTARELLDICCGSPSSELSLPDEKTIRSDLKYLEEVGVIKREPGPRPYRYRIQDDLIRDLSDEELIDLYDFVDVMANTQIPSVQGYLLRDGLKKHLLRKAFEPHAVEPFLYKYHYYSRILDEAHLFTLLHAIRHRRKVRFLYFSPKSDKSYASKNTNPLFERDANGRAEKTLPLKIVYDHQYGRWYLLSYSRSVIRKYRMEGITQIEEEEAVDEAWYEEKKSELAEKIRYSWLIDTGRLVTIRARFFNPEGSEPNFIKERVLLQGQWGEIVFEDEHSFIYEIPVNGTTEIKPWLRSFGSSCEVLEPASFRQEMIAEWKEIQSYYESV
ncbi:Predicted DNA-binding transcriptional regulator YafY, contains an HTH and WYL domains [Paenibacillus sp. UNCCL117]|uniref:helix-turn-helix transcriptional regulator n=1 Tax=unclassified Paenibacillus TaxID=185978 RepID=UPI00089078A4|nr:MULTISPECIES: WYL domain-containing protein [unclassified Paenibacillus]SDE48433.1 Predicted DNA-binding transcriptional regulator YafY, contains an HTH and WYL domains [Paenibacillus sp. cl123]SFW66663.1 Predicted DNA-binding transcriptional regulator YafY, contains an HTH and WYL domains [Paenibacillus sp. UNCCL117]